LKNLDELEEKVQGFQNALAALAHMAIAYKLEAADAIVRHLLYYERMRTRHSFQVEWNTRLNTNTI
jgi:UDP-N-acetylmuramate-alanine ligase